MKANIHFSRILMKYLIIKNVSEMFLEKIRIKLNVQFLVQKIVHLLDYAEKLRRTRQATHDNTMHAHFKMHTQGYRYSFGICNTYWFSTTTMVKRTRNTVTFTRTTLPLLGLVCVLKESSLSDQLILVERGRTVFVCLMVRGLETSTIRLSKPGLGSCATEKEEIVY